MQIVKIRSAHLASKDVVNALMIKLVMYATLAKVTENSLTNVLIVHLVV